MAAGELGDSLELRRQFGDRPAKTAGASDLYTPPPRPSALIATVLFPSRLLSSEMTMSDMQRIQRIDGELTKLFQEFEPIARSLEFQQLGDLLDVDLESLLFPGLYFLEVWSSPYGAEKLEGWFSNFTAAWDQEQFKKSFVPSCQKGRIAKHTTIHEWMPLYLGKSEKVGRRVWEHLNLEAEKRTFALKLKARNLLQGNRYRLSVLRLDVINYSVLAPKIEAALRRKHLPLVGRQ